MTQTSGKLYVVLVGVDIAGDPGTHRMAFKPDGVSFDEALTMIRNMSSQQSIERFPFKGHIERISFTLVAKDYMQSMVDADRPPGATSH